MARCCCAGGRSGCCWPSTRASRRWRSWLVRPQRRSRSRTSTPTCLKRHGGTRRPVPASESQQNLLPPRIARVSRGILAGNVLPGYGIGGDWFDYVENSDGAWIGVADSMGKGTTAAALAIHHTMLEIVVQGAFVNVLLGRWHGPSSMFSSITCGHQPPLLITEQGELIELDYTEHPALGLGEPARRFTTDGRRLEPGERLLLLSDGVLERRRHDGEPFGLDGVCGVIADALDAAAAWTVRALEDAITAASADPLQDDATIVVFAPTRPH
jgi:serine phosphatase RsbU (regulator of sigma subunit)